MTLQTWWETRSRLPPDGKVVETKIHDADGESNHQDLVLQGRMWFFPDWSMYIYYCPTHWREKI